MMQFDLKYGTPLHTRIRQAIKDRYRMSYDKMSKYHETWKDAEERLIAYRRTTVEDERRKDKRDSGKPQFTTIEVPYSYAMLMTAQTYWSTVFMGRSPIFQFSGRHGETELQTQGMEAIIDYQTTVGEMLAPLFIWLLDQGKYGLGVICNYWSDEDVVVSSIEERPVTYMGIPIPGKNQKVRVSKRIKGYSGNKIFNVRPFDWFPDPRVPAKDFQRGEFCARKVELSWNELLKGQASGRYQNIDVLRKVVKAKQNDEEYGTAQVERPEINQTADALDIGFTTGLEMTIELVPSEWGLGSNRYPEKWIFTLAADEVIVNIRPAGNWHGKFPFQVLEYEQDGYALVPRGMPEITEALNDVMTWLVNSHFHNVRKVLNDQLIYDPSRIVGKDLADPAAGRLIRLKPAAYGQDPRLSVHQLQTVDVTQNHLRDVQVVADMLHRVTGVTDNIMGMVNAGGRKTATEVRTSSSFGANRLKMQCEYQSVLGWGPLAQMLVQNTQQYYSDEKQFRIAGNMMQGVEFRRLTPDDIQGFYDFVAVDGTLPVDRFAQANLWREIMVQMASIPQLAMQYDLGAIFAYTAKLAGAKSVDQFKIKVTPDEQLQQAAQAGNVVPLGGPNGSGGDPVSTERFARVKEPGQIAGMGTSG